MSAAAGAAIAEEIATEMTGLSMITFRHVTGMHALLPEADAFLLDQFGTIHDGVALYSGARQTMERLRAAGKRILILSNSGKRSEPNIARLARIGLPPDCYDGFLSSGEVAWRMLAMDRPTALANVRSCLVLSRGDDPMALAGLGLDRTEDAARCDLILLLGSEADRISLDAYRDRLRPAAERGVPCLCANPDRTMVLSDGALAPAAGRIAEVYAQMGGPVMWIGKPAAAIYDAALTLFADVDPGRIWAVGDSVEHDIAGAAAHGCRSALVMTGIMAGQGDDGIAKEIARFGVTPDAIMPTFTWPD
ncbi:TIGR01459 family HAD-type hydrolase [Acidisoma cladoniae]|uniref:TIGR01459 family HAD-type hydrolase n=1 Tax=Acidisoma cladoniae TaxID=3040935 RepID=UPI00254C4879|nr:TIGR01459 family HAD-type hydrolase [Acidisoma sp. PAMC 29798]